MNENSTQEAFDRLYHQLVEERLQMKEGFTIAKEELISATPELLELKVFLEKFQKEKPKPVLQWHETAGCIAGTGQALPIEPAEIKRLNELARPALRWYPSWADFVASTTPTDSNCLRCGDPLFGIATALCIECHEEQQKEKKDFKFAEWD